MIARKVRVQIIVFAVIAVVGITYVGGRYAGLDRLLGPRGYVVTAQFVDSGGIFTNAEVTYRGLTIGRVGPLRLTRSGVDVELDIDSKSTMVPADVDAVVANRSGVGEQYVDLRPRTAAGPYLRSGSVIPSSRTSIPLPPEDLLSHLDRTVTSVPTDSLRTVVDELGTGFTDTRTQLATLLDNSSSYTEEAVNQLPQTRDLIANSRTVLETQRAQSGDIAAFSHDMRLLAGQLRASDPDYRRVIAAAPGAAQQISDLLRESGPNLGVLIANLLTVANVYKARLNGVEETLVVYPVVTGGAKTVAPGDGTAHFGMVLNSFDPNSCVRGYEQTHQRTGTDTAPAPANNLAYCAEPPGSPTDVRGAQNSPGQHAR
jgi:phospholipid/cholesterol/gamma-HCH transport system substrate-binding protein